MTEPIIWPGWIAGAGIGLYLLLQYWITGKALGCSTGYGSVLGAVGRFSFFRSGAYGDRWRLWFMLGLPLGGLVAALSSGGVGVGLAMGMYDAVLPQNLALKGLFLAAGGALIGYGSRMAGGCQSGHSINGMSQLSLPSVIASLGFFVGGIAGVQVLFRVFGGLS